MSITTGSAPSTRTIRRIKEKVIRFTKRIKWLTIGGYFYLFYALTCVSASQDWFEFAKSLVVLAIAIVAFGLIGSKEPTT